MANDMRRPLKSRSHPAIQGLARSLAKTGITPNQISVLSIFISAIGAAALVASPSQVQGYRFADQGVVYSVNALHYPFPARLLFFAGAACIQLRLLCNVLDGLIAVEGGKKSPTGAIYNELPDRIADIFTLVALGYSIPLYSHAIEMAWCAAVLAVCIAYIRALGGSLGLEQNFAGPMAKPHRMFTATLICLFAAFVPSSMVAQVVMAGLGVIIVGSLITMVRRTSAIARELNAR
jgi:phosphatidylglycerophosphate synthase